jgi:hypothetical protein
MRRLRVAVGAQGPGAGAAELAALLDALDSRIRRRRKSSTGGASSGSSSSSSKGGDGKGKG